MAWVHARRGPLVGRRVEIPDDEVETAIAEYGWAQAFVPGTVLVTEPDFPHDLKWKIPGVEMPIVEGRTVRAKPAETEDSEKPHTRKK